MPHEIPKTTSAAPEQWRASLLTTLLRAAAALGALVYLPSLYLAHSSGMPGVIAMDTLAFIGVLALNFTPGIPFRARAFGFSLICYGLGVGLLVTVGPISQIYLIGYSLLTTLLLGRRAGLFSVGVNGATLLVIGLWGAAAPEMHVPGWEGSPAAWYVIALNFLLVNGLLALALGSIIAALERAATLQREALAEAEVNEERFRLLSRATNDAIWDWNLATDAVWWNEGFETLFGYRREEVEPDSQAWTGRIHPDDKDAVLDSIHRVIDGDGAYWTASYRFRRADGSHAYVLDRGFVIRDDTGRAVRMLGGMTDLSAIKEAEQRLAQQAALLDQASDAILVRDLDHRLLFWNRAATALYGWDEAEALGKPADALLQPEQARFQEAVAEVLETGVWSGELRQRTKAGAAVTVLARWTLMRDELGGPKSILVIEADITERKRLEQQILRAQRMESLGTLAGGIAHDLNNVLAPILMATEVLREHLRDEAGQEILRTVRASAQRGADLVKQVLTFARGVEGDHQPLAPAGILLEVRDILRDTFPRSVDIAAEIPEGIWNIEADPTQIQQVLMNLCVNARDAMPEGGRLTLALENMVVDEVYSGMNLEAKPGPYVVLRVEDTGSGMDKALQERIFEPFFTTKELGKGTGLGLSTTFSIVRNHGGFINVYSEPGKGTRFKVYLPATTEEARVREVAARRSTLPRGRGELVLLVDDEAGIREIATRALERHGYRVIVATNGAEGVSAFAQHRGEIAVVLTDMSMPVMDGPSMIVALKAIDPAVRVIGSSSLPVNGHVAKALGAGVDHFVPKPYTAESLLQTLRLVIDGPEAGRECGAAHPEPAPEPLPESVPPREADPPDRPCVLVVDDEDALRGLARVALQSGGFEVLLAASGHEALRVLEEREAPVHVLLTDLQMSPMNGFELARAARDLRGEIRVVFMTGGNAGIAAIRDEFGETAKLLPKPYNIPQLRQVVREALDA